MSPIEKLIARTACQRLIEAGYYITVDYYRGYEASDVINRNSLDGILDAMDAVDECWLMLNRDPVTITDGQPDEPYDAWVYFIWSNGDDGRTCISDYDVSLSSLIEPWYGNDTWADAQIDRAFAALDLLPDALVVLEGMATIRKPGDMIDRLQSVIK